MQEGSEGASDPPHAAADAPAGALRTIPAMRFPAELPVVERREDLEAVVRNELRDPGLADRLLMDHEGLEVDYAFRLRRRCG